MKKITAIILVLFMLALCACGNAASDATDGNGTVGGVTDTVENNTEEATENTGEAQTKESTADTVPEETAPAFAVNTLSAWGLAEPSFTYEFVGYSEAANGPVLCAKFYYIASADFAAAQAYVELVSNSGWGGSVPDPNEARGFGYTGELDDYKIRCYWEEDGSVLIWVTDHGASAVWDDDADTYVIPQYGEYGSYGEYNADYMYG